MSGDRRERGFLFGRPPTRAESAGELQRLPDWQQSDPKWIKSAVRRAMALPAGGWHVIDAARAVGARPRRYRIDDRELVVWRAAPAACW